MKTITFKSKKYSCKSHETVLEALLRNGVDIPYSCKAGICDTCSMHLLDGKLERKSEIFSVNPKLSASTFLPCVCKPTTDIIIEPAVDSKKFKGLVVSKELIAPDIIRLLIKPETMIGYQGGQFVNITSPTGVTRSYSIASIFNEYQDSCLELHIKQVPSGLMTEWMFNELEVGQEVDVAGPYGSCHYQFSEAKKLLLIGAGTGLAPLLGVIKDALRYEHKADIVLYHHASHESGFYLRNKLSDLANKHANFSYHLVLANSSANESLGVITNQFTHRAIKDISDFENWDVFVCGAPDMVYKTHAQVIAAGAKPESIYIDAFETAPRDEAGALANNHDDGDIYPEPDMDIWEELQEGVLLRKILEEFYEQVYEDPVLSPFFADVSKQHAISKQYSFLYKLFTGEDVYFGDRPRNAHHWMVITDEIFDHREALFEKVLIQNDVAETTRQKWLDMHESYRKYMVKEKPWPRIIQGIVQPISGFSRIKLEIDYICDSCNAELSAGASVLYNLDAGQLYCDDCSNSAALG